MGESQPQCEDYFGPYDGRTRASLAWQVLSLRPRDSVANEKALDSERAYLHNCEGGRMERRMWDAGSLELTESEPGAVVSLHDTGLEEAFGPLSALGGMAIKTTPAGVAM